jgi:hypothetical protein
MSRLAKPLAVVALSVLAAGLVGLSGAAMAERIDNDVAVFSALDKVTARISKFEVKLGETYRFGSLKVTPRTCYSRPPTEPPKTSSFVEVDEVQLDGQEKRVFTGWMLAESPGLNAVEHAVFDVWLSRCTTPRPASAKGPGGPQPPGTQAQPGDDPLETRRRPRR